MTSHQFNWPEGEKLVFVRPPVEEYHGHLANFYDPALFPELAPLKKHWKEIRDEILEFERTKGLINEMTATTPAKMYGGNWSLIVLSSMRRLRHENRKRFPLICSITDKIPNIVFVGVSIMPPNTEIAPHYGDTNGIVRSHLALIIPAPYPTIGIKVGEEERGWEEGELLSFINVQKHNVWNKSPQRRYVLMIDSVPNILQHRTMEICSKGLGSQTFNYLWMLFPVLKHTPAFVHNLIVAAATITWRIYLPVQRRFKFLP